MEHIPKREDALRRMVAALKPGGWLVCEDTDNVSVALISPLDARSRALFMKVEAAKDRVMAARGHEYCARDLYGLFSVLGLVEVHVEARRAAALCGYPSRPMEAVVGGTTPERHRSQSTCDGIGDRGILWIARRAGLRLAGFYCYDGVGAPPRCMTSGTLPKLFGEQQSSIFSLPDSDLESREVYCSSVAGPRYHR